jgi:hypothetical protein
MEMIKREGGERMTKGEKFWEWLKFAFVTAAFFGFLILAFLMIWEG